MADQVRVFVSHHHSPEEDAFTARLVADLKAAGADVWVDTAGIPSGSFVAKISEGLAGRQWVVLVMTPDALASLWVRTEVEAGLNEYHARRMLGVIPLVMQPCREEDIPLLWRTLQRYDATNGYDIARGKFFAALGLTPGETPPPIHPSPPAYNAPPDRFPPRLASLGYRVEFLDGAEVILPPLCEVPAGPFLMGSDPNKDKETQDFEKPQHWVKLGVYQVAQHPLTVAEYACFVRATGRPAPTPYVGKRSHVSWQTQMRERLDHPLVMVSWQDATAYAKWLAERTGEQWRLPTEAEWEKAARWDAATGAAYLYPWGDQFDASRCNTDEGKKRMTTPVGSYSTGASPCGAQDMAGNVWEWTSTMLKPYPYSATDGREEAETTSDRVRRGGSWESVARVVRAAYRTTVHHPDSVLNLLGFRLARSVPNS